MLLRTQVAASWALVALGVCADIATAHHGHQATTYEVTAADRSIDSAKHLRLNITVGSGGERIAARFTVMVDGESYVPPALGEHGLRFVSLHRGKKNRFVATYARGTGDVLVPLPPTASRGTVVVSKGFEFRSVSSEFVVAAQCTTVDIPVPRWANLQADGWHAADEHLHYERTEAIHDRDWLAMLNADGLSHAHFLVLKGGNVPGIWASQFAYGNAGEANDGSRWIRPGEEYRDSTQGHINLLGINEIIQPISTGGIGTPRVPFNYPPLLDVFRRTHNRGGIGGPAHGGSLAKSSTAALDTILGEVDFFEIANTHLYKTDVWYRLLNCGFIVPPMAGTDLPNFGFRDPWQPFLGEVRTYVQLGSDRGFDAWKRSVREGKVFVTSGPLIELDIDGQGPGGVIRLPPEGGEVTVTARLESPRPLQSLEIIQMGAAIASEVKQSHDDELHRRSISMRVPIQASCWFAARGRGGPKLAVQRGLNIQQDEIAHTGIVQVLVGDRPIRSEADLVDLRRQLVAQQEYYRANANYERSEHRVRFIELFERAIRRLQ